MGCCCAFASTRGSSVSAITCVIAGPLPKIEEREDENPDEIDEVPIEARNLDDLIASLPACEKAPPRVVEIAAHDLSRHEDQEDHTDRHMSSVAAGDHKEAGTELGRAPGIAPGPHALPDQLCPFEGL